MIALALIALPLLAGGLLFFGPVRQYRLWVLVAVSLACAAGAGVEALWPVAPFLPAEWVRIDATARLFLVLVNAIYLGVAVYVWFRTSTEPHLVEQGGRLAAFSLLFLGACNAVIVANQLTAQWVALEVTTLAMAPLVIRPAASASRRASWRYLLFSSVALGLVLMGLALIGHALGELHRDTSLVIDHLPPLEGRAAQLGLALVLLGLGTKLGLAPMYSWLPETYDEAPPTVATLLGAVQFNVALVMLLRVIEAWKPSFPQLVTTMLLGMGLVSMLVSTASIIATTNMKRLLAYASINHAGVIAIGLGLGEGAAYGVLLYVISNAIIKAILFLTAGRIKAHYRSKDTRQIQGLIKDLPFSGAFLMVGTFALLGFPPFGSFFGELLILSGLVATGHLFAFAAFCVLITMTFVATGRTIFPMIWGTPKTKVSWPQQRLVHVLPKFVFLIALVALGVYVPPGVDRLLTEVARQVGGAP